MDTRFPLQPKDVERSADVRLYSAGVSIPTVVSGAGGYVDLAPHASQVSQTAKEVIVNLNWHYELYGSGTPKPGQVLAVLVNNTILWVGIVESVNDYRVQKGSRAMSITARSRDATPMWREIPRATRAYPQGTRLDLIARDVARSVGLTTAEIKLPSVGIHTPSSHTQLAGISAWQMLESLLIPAGRYPIIDALGRLKSISRDFKRPADIQITDDRLESVNGSRSRPPLTRLRLKWLSPDLVEAVQQDQALATANITAGYFQIHQHQDVTFSSDGSQRAHDTYLVVKQSANSGLFNVCDELYIQLGETSGQIQLNTSEWVPALLGLFLLTKAAGALPDIAPPFGGPTFPSGKMVQALLEFGVFLILASVGTGSYEVRGSPYDFVNARNVTEAYLPSATSWVEKAEDLEMDFIANEQHAQSVVSREFIYRALSSNSYGVSIVDDFRVEEGDILGLPDGSRVYVTGYTRDLTRGAAAVLNVQGFQV